jgi:hypothetical protein
MLEVLLCNFVSCNFCVKTLLEGPFIQVPCNKRVFYLCEAVSEKLIVAQLVNNSPSLWNPKARYSVQKIQPPASLLRQMNQVHATTLNFPKVNFNIIFLVLSE